MIQFDTLSNGVRVVTEHMPGLASASLGVWITAGGRHERARENGIAHFLEHMAFKGTAVRTVDDVNRELDAVSPHYNAATSEETTVYYAMVLPESQDRIVQLLADLLRPALRPEDFETEKQVIVEEIRKYEDQPPFGADDKCRAHYFANHPLGQSVLGTVESIRGLSVEAMREYFQRRYGADNVVMAAAGRVDFDALVDSASRCCAGWQRGDNARTLEPAAPRQGFHVLHKPIATQQYLLRLSPAPAATDEDRFAAELLAMALGDETGSRLFWELIDPGLADHVSVAHREHEGAGVMMTALGCEPDLAAENLERLDDVSCRTQAEGITEEELDQAKNKYRSRMVLAGERPAGRLFALAGDWVYRREYRSLDTELAAVAAVTTEDVTALLAKYPLDRATTVTIGPLDELTPLS